MYFCSKYVRVVKLRRLRIVLRRVDDVVSVDMKYIIDFEFKKHEEVSPKVIGKMWKRFSVYVTGYFYGTYIRRYSLMSKVSWFYCNSKFIIYIPRARFKTFMFCTPNVSVSIHFPYTCCTLCYVLSFVSRIHIKHRTLCVCVCRFQTV